MAVKSDTTNPVRETMLEKVRAERERQIEKWGDRTHPDNGRTAVEWSAILNEEAGELAEVALSHHFGSRPRFATIQHEAIQTAAVALAIAEAADNLAIHSRDA